MVGNFRTEVGRGDWAEQYSDYHFDDLDIAGNLLKHSWKNIQQNWDLLLVVNLRCDVYFPMRSCVKITFISDNEEKHCFGPVP